jgi:eukaryotic-like serine/threonine-protein kinase
MYCTHCGAGLPDNVLACPACNRPTASSVVTSAPMSSTTPESDPGLTSLAHDEPVTALASGTNRDLSGRRGTAGSAAPLAGTAPQGHLALGSAFGSRYHIIRLLGVGGMGAVYQAWDDSLGVAVALKIVRPEITADPDAARELERRFKRELLLARQVTHKNVVRIHDLGEIDGIKYLTMPYIQGNDLATILRTQGKLPVRQALLIARQVVDGLQAAHEAGVVHRDLKPANIMIDGDDHAVIMDFGIARSVSGGATVAGAVVGTLEYMAPEQAMAHSVDHRADIYALGLILYDMVLGPRSATRAESAVAELMARVQRPLPPARSIDPSIPEVLERIIDRCTQPEPAARYQTTEQLARDLHLLDPAGRQTAGTGALSAPIITRTSAAPAQISARRGVSRAAILSAVAVIVALAAAAWGLRDSIFGSAPKTDSAAAQVTLAIIPFQNGTGDPSLDWLGPSLAEMLAGEVGQSSQLRPVSPDRVFQLLRDLRIQPTTDVDTRLITRIADFLSANNIVAGRIVKLGDQLRIEAALHPRGGEPKSLAVTAEGEKEIPRAAQQLAASIRENLSLTPEAVRELQAKAFRPSSQSVAALRHYNEGLQLARQGEHLKAVKHFEEATAADARFALAYAKLGQTLATLGRSADASQAARQAVSLSGNLPSDERDLIVGTTGLITNDIDKAIESYERLLRGRPGDIQLHYELAVLYENKGALDRARDEYNKVLEADPKYVAALYAAGRVAILRGDYQGSIDPLTRAHALSIQLDHQESKARILQALGIAYKNLGKLDEALNHFQQSLAIKRQINERRGQAASLNEIAAIHHIQGRTDEALKSYQQSLEIRRDIGDRRGLGLTLINLGAMHIDRGRYGDALGAFKEALQIYRDVGDAANQALCFSNIGNIYLARAEHEEARTYLERAVELREKANVPVDLARSLASLADVSVRLGEYDRAQTQYLRAIDLWRKADDRRGVAIGSYGMGTLLAQQGRYGAAIDATGEAVKTFRELKERSFWLAESLGGYGAALSLAGRFEEADKSLAESLAIARQLKNDTLVVQTLHSQGDNAYFRGDLKSARSVYEQAHVAARAAGSPYLILGSALKVARLNVEDGRAGAAAELRKLIRDAEALGARPLAAEAGVFLGAALLATKQPADALVVLNESLAIAERLGAIALLARLHHLIGESLQLSGRQADAAAHEAKARQFVDEIRKHARVDTVLARRDLRDLVSTPAR